MRTKITEADLEKWVIRNLSQIEEGLTLVGRQIDLQAYGQLDLLCKDKRRRYVVVELKSPDEQVDAGIISQTFRYRTGVHEKYDVADPTRIRVLCYVHNIDPNVRKVCEQAGIGVVIYTLGELNKILISEKNFPERTIGKMSETESKHAILPVRLGFFPRLERFCWYDVKEPLKWIQQGSVIIFYSKKRLVAEAKVLRVERSFEAKRQLNKFLRYCGYLSTPYSTLHNTVVFYSEFRKYDPPISWESFLQKFQKKGFSPIRQPRIIDDIELGWIQGKDLRALV